MGDKQIMLSFMRVHAPAILLQPCHHKAEWSTLARHAERVRLARTNYAAIAVMLLAHGVKILPARVVDDVAAIR